MRTRELAASLGVLGVTEHHWLGYPDGGCHAVDQDDGATYHPDHMAVSRGAAAVGTRARVLHQVQTPEWRAELNKLIPREVVMMADREVSNRGGVEVRGLPQPRG